MKTPEIKKDLEANNLYKSLEPHELETLIVHAKHSSFPAGTTIIKQGSKSEGIYIILEGSVIIAGQIVGEGRVNLTSLKQGNIFGGSSIIVNGPHATSVIAETEVRCLMISAKLFEMFSIFYPGMKYKIAKEVAENACNRLIQVSEKIKLAMSTIDMTTLSIFGEVVRSLTKPSLLTPEEVSLNINDLRHSYPLSLFNGEHNEILKRSILIKAPNQCPLIEQGDKDSSSYLVLKGAVQSSLVLKHKLAKVSVLGPLSLFSPISVIHDQMPALYNYTTCERAILLKIEKATLNELQLKHPAIWYKLFDVICESFIVLGRFTEKLDIRINSETYNR